MVKRDGGVRKTGIVGVIEKRETGGGEDRDSRGDRETGDGGGKTGIVGVIEKRETGGGRQG